MASPPLDELKKTTAAGVYAIKLSRIRYFFDEISEYIVRVINRSFS
jgi:hypothetical protein